MWVTSLLGMPLGWTANFVISEDYEATSELSNM